MTTATEKAAVTEKTDKQDGTDPATKASEKPSAIPGSPRRALGRGLESLLGGPRVVSPASTVSNTTEVASTAVGARVETPEAHHASAALQPPVILPGANSDSIADLSPAAGRTSRSHGEDVIELRPDAVVENPYQTRKVFEQALLDELARSIQAHGLLQPIVVRPAKDGTYALILGARRLRAAKLAGLQTIPAVVRRVNDEQAAEMTVVENIQRADLRCIEQAEAFAMLSREFGLTQEEIGKKTGCSRETVSNYMRLLKLPSQVHQFLNN